MRSATRAYKLTFSRRENMRVAKPKEFPACSSFSPRQPNYLLSEEARYTYMHSHAREIFQKYTS